MRNGPPEETSELVHRLENRQRRGIMATLIGLLVAAAIAGVIVRVSYLEARKQLPALGALSNELAQGRQELTQARREITRTKRETQRIQEELERLRKEKLQADAEAQRLNRGGSKAKPGARSDPKQLREMQKQVNRLQQELSATQQKLKQERQNVAVLGEETDRYRQVAAELQRRADELEKTLAERDYLRLVNEALAYTYRKGPGDEKRAETAYRNAVQLAQARNIRDPVIYSAYAVFLQEHKRLQEAEKFYKMALELNPKYGPALYNLGNLYEVRGNLKKAMEKYKAADEVGEKLGRENYLRLRSIIKQ